MAFRLVTSASRRLRSTICIPRDTRIGGARTNGNRLGYKWAETQFISEAEPKPDFFWYKNEFGMFGAYLVEEDGTITRSPKYNKYPPSFKMEREGPFFWTSCDGLIYLHYPNRNHVLWNPTTHEYKILPEPYAHPSRFLNYVHQAWGMWHDHTSQDYIVLNLLETSIGLDSSVFIYLYSLKTNSWKRIPCPTSHCFGIHTSRVCFSGILYCTTTRAILSFDISTQTFSNIPLPKGCCRSNHRPPGPHILEYKGLLSVLYSKDAARQVLREYQLWVMRDGLWTRESVFCIRGVWKPLWFSKDGKLLYFVSRTSDMVVFDFATGKSKHLGVDGPFHNDREMIPFVENFVQLNGISCIEESRNNIKSEVCFSPPPKLAARFSSSPTPIFSSLKDGMAFRLATSATRQLPLCSRVRSTISFSGSRAQFAPRVEVNTRIEGAPPRSNDENELGPQNGPFVSETTLSSCDICPKPKPKPDIFVKYRDSYRKKYHYEEYFVAYSLKEDGTISPKYFIYPPSFPTGDYVFTGASCNGVLHFHDRKSGGQALWNPTTGGYKILPKPSVELGPHALDINGLWSDHRFEDYKVLNIAALWDESGGELPKDVSYYIDLYSLKLNSWRRIPCTDFECGDESVCVAGVFYCEAFLNKTRVILSFDFSTETLSTLPSPPNENCDQHYFLDYKGLLSVLASWWEWDEDLDDELPWKYELWIMSAGSWTRESVFHVRGVEKPIWFSQDGKLLYFASVDDELVMFDRTTGKLNHLGVDCDTTKGMIPFFESFVQLN